MQGGYQLFDIGKIYKEFILAGDDEFSMKKYTQMTQDLKF